MALASASAVASGFGALNLYWGQKTGDRLRAHCDTGVDYVTLSFVNTAPENHPSGWPGTNFGPWCWDTQYDNKDVKSALLKDCVTIKEDIPYCQSKGVKVLLSIGGVYNAQTSNYRVTTDANGRSFADFLHFAFGPYQSSWGTNPRPFDQSPTQHVSVDGFDFDIEKNFDNKPYIAMIETLQEWNPTYFISAAPQCPIANNDLTEMIQKARLDALFVQFYNNPVCDYIEGNTPGDKFNYDEWVSVLAKSEKSKNAKLYVGLPSNSTAAGSGYISPAAVKELVCRNKGKENWGGISLWEANLGSSGKIGTKNFNQHVQDALKYGCDPVPTTTSTTAKPTSTSTEASSTSTEASSTSTEASSTSTEASSTSTEVSSTSTSSKLTTTSTASSTSSKPSTTSTVSSVSSSSTDRGISSTTSSSSSSSSSVVVVLPPPINETTTSTWSWSNSSFTTTSTQSSGSSATLSATFDGSASVTTTSVGQITSTTSVRLTTSTVYTTKVTTVTKCPDSVPDCPSGGYVTTETIPIYTTVCPVTESEATQPAMTEASVPLTTSTVHTTKTYVVTACPPEVANCPVGSVTTEVTSYTTVCPVTETETETKPSQPTGEVPVESSAHAEPTESIRVIKLYSSSSSSSSSAVVEPSLSVPAVKTLSPSSGLETSTRPVVPTYVPVPPTKGCTGPGCPVASIPTGSGNNSTHPVPPTVVPTPPPVGSASGLAISFASLFAVAVLQMLVF